MAEEQLGQEQQNQRYQNMQGQTAPGKPLEQADQKPDTADTSARHRYCKYCERPLASDVVFCNNCGEKHGGEENICPYCGQATTKKNCPKCQNPVVPYICSKCGAKTTNPICACGAILDKKIQAAMQAEAQAAQESVPAIRQMTAEEVQKIEEIFRVEEEKPDFKKFRKRLLEREKLLMERDYYNNMQREIIEVFGERPFRIELPDPEEQAAMMRLYSSLEQSIIKKQRRATQEELEAMYPELRHIHEAENKAAEEREAAEEANRQRRMEQAKRKKVMEEKYRAILEDVDREIQEAKSEARQADETKKAEEKERLLAQKAEEEAQFQREREETEKKAKEEAERRARIAAAERAAAEAKAKAEVEKRAREEAERIAKEQKDAVEKEAAKLAAQREKERKEAQERAERQAYLNRILGTYYYEGNTEKLTIIIESQTNAYCKDKFQNNSSIVYSTHDLTFNGSKLTLKEVTNPSGYPMCKKFIGELNNKGTTITGNWYRDNNEQNRLITYYKVN